MSYLALARKWRPRNFSELVGQTHVRTALENALSQGRLHPALLFSGTRGVGKTTLARIIARSLNCETGVTATPCGQCSACKEIEEGRFVDLIEVDAASRTKVDDTRELLDNVPYAPARGRYKVYLIDEVHMLSKSSFNALLKTLEEPPSHVQFLFATTDPQKLPITVLSRCLQFNLKRINPQDIAERMRFILGEEKIVADDEGLSRLARAADGSLRDGLSLLDQAIAFGGGEVKGEAVSKMLGSIERRDLLHLVAAISQQDATAAWAVIDNIEEQGLDFAEVLDELCRLWQRLAVGQQVPQALDEVEMTDLQDYLQSFSAADLQVFYQIAVNARRDLDWAPDPRSGFEMVVLRTLAFLPDKAAASSRGGPVGGGAVVPVAGIKAAPQKPQARQQLQDTQISPAGSVQQKSEKPASADVLPAWPKLIEHLNLSGSVNMVASGCSLISQTPDQLTLEVGRQVQALCTGSVEKRLAAALKSVFGDVFQLSLQRAQVQAPEEGVDTTPEQQFLEQAGVRKAMDMFQAELQPGSFRLHTDDSADQSYH
ncbi:MAG: DNA polymerase III subunit gamma/tau [Oceanococcus sp.]